MKRILAMVLLVAGVAGAQTMSPIVQECGRKCSGSFTVTNNTLVPMAVTIETYSSSFNSSGQAFRPLDPTVHVSLSETSSRLSPREAHEFSYHVKCDQLPCTFSFLAGMVVGRTEQGLQVRVILPHSIYSCDKVKNCRKGILTQAGLLK